MAGKIVARSLSMLSGPAPLSATPHPTLVTPGSTGGHGYPATMLRSSCLAVGWDRRINPTPRDPIPLRQENAEVLLTSQCRFKMLNSKLHL